MMIAVVRETPNFVIVEITWASGKTDVVIYNKYMTESQREARFAQPAEQLYEEG